jgi:hypothetical protein
MKLKLLNRIRALENTIASTYVLPNIRIVFVDGSGNPSPDIVCAINDSCELQTPARRRIASDNTR